MPQISALEQVFSTNSWKGVKELKIKCPVCDTGDWCFISPDFEAVQCDRAQRLTSIPDGWRYVKDGKDGRPIYRFGEPPKKAARQGGREEYIYTDNQGNQLIKVVVVRPGKVRDKDVWQEYWGGMVWVQASTFPKDKKQEYQQRVTWFRYADVTNAIKENKFIFIVEGEGVVNTLWNLGIAATTTIGGANKYRKYGIGYKEDLGDCETILCPDRDTPGLEHMEDMSKDFPDSKWLYAPPSDFYWSHLPKSQGLDVVDWVMSGATADDIKAAIQERKIVVEVLEKTLEKEAERSRATKSKHEMNFNLIQATWGDKLRWNILKKCVELDGVKLPLDRIDLEIALACHIDISKEQAKGIVLKLALVNSYNPVVEYLDSIQNLQTDSSILDALASNYLGTTDPLHAALIKRTLISAVARAYDPGCKHDELCILRGNQGQLKSTFWEVLAGQNFFTDDLGGSEKDEIMKLSQYWLLEYSEFETAFSKKEVSQLKAFLSRRSDSIRRPYGTDIEDMPRPSIFVGTTNKSEFLKDPTGERRYWVVPVHVRKINIAQLKEERDRIWAAAVKLYKAGEQWHLTDEEDKLLRIANGEYQVSDSWEEEIARHVINRPYVVVSDIMYEVLHLELAKRDARTEMRVADCLRRLGWQKAPKQRRINGAVKRVWEPAVSEIEVVTSQIATPQCDEKIREVVTASNPCIESISDVLSLPTLPSGMTFQDPKEKENIKDEQISSGELQETMVTVVTETESIATQVVDSVTTPVTIAVTAIESAVLTGDWEKVEAVTNGWDKEFKLSVWRSLCDSSKRAIKDLKEGAFNIGDKVLWTGDAFNAAYDCQGEVLFKLGSNYKVRWTKNDGKCFERGEETLYLRLVE
jgi:predicted P-loop ATPase